MKNIIFLFTFYLLSSQLFAQQIKKEPLNIGFSIVATDPAGRPALKAVRLAIDLINKTAGYKAVNLFVEYLPNREYGLVANSITNLIRKGTTVILSSGGSGITLKVSETTIANKVLLFSGSSSSPRISTLKDNNLVWRTIPSDKYQGKIAAKIIDSLQFKNVGIININNPYGTALADVCKMELEQRGKTTVTTVSYDEKQEYSTVNFNTQLQNLFKSKPEVIYLVTYGEDGARIINQAYTKGFITETYKPLFIGCDANYNNDFLLGIESTSRVEGMLGLVYTHPRDNKDFTEFMQLYSAFNEPQDSADMANASLATLLNVEATSAYAANAFDAVFSIVLASISASTNEGALIAAEIQNVTKQRPGVEKIGFSQFGRALSLMQKGAKVNFEGCSGPVEFDENGDVNTGNYQLWKIVKGNFTNLKVIQTENISSGKGK